MNIFSLDRILWLPSNENGATILEFALAALVLFFLFGAIFDVGLGIHRYAIVKHVTSEVTRIIAADLQTHRECKQVEYHLINNGTKSLTQKLDTNTVPHWTMNWDTSGTGKMFPVMTVRADFKVKCYFLCMFASDGGWRASTSSEIVIERSGIGPGGQGCPNVSVGAMP